jgi:hypothetical protein
MARRLYIYYRVAADDLVAVRAAARAMQAGLCSAHPGLQAELLRRPELQAGDITLMEAYRMAGDKTEADPTAGGVDVALQADIERAAAVLGGWLRGARHVEGFVEL